MNADTIKRAEVKRMSFFQKKKNERNIQRKN